MIIYKTTNKTNGKIYVGFDSLNRPIEQYAGSGLLLKRAIQKYGLNNFEKEVLEHVSEDNWQEREKHWIETLNAQSTGYNITPGGIGGDTLSNHPDLDEIKKKLSIKNTGRVFTEERNQKISSALKGRQFSEEHKKAISENHHDVTGENNPMYGKKHKEESRKKMSEIHSGKVLSEDHKRKLGEASKGKTYEERYGEEKAKELREKRSLALKGKPKSEEARLKMSIAAKNRIRKKKEDTTAQA
jgi:group I intron endonuclease